MLPRYPVKINRNFDANKAVVFCKNPSFRVDAIFEARPKPGVDVTRDIDSCSSDKVIPAPLLMAVLLYSMVPDSSYHEVRV